MSIEYSVIVPAYHEKLNIKPLTTRLFAGMSPEMAKKEVDALAHQGYNVRIIVRTNERGLSSAVLKGFYEAKGQYLVCMDADLQHPPETVPKLFESLHDHAFTLGTRYAPGVGIDKDWPMYRRVISSTARMMARPLTIASDPMSGFFGLQKKYLENCNPRDINSQGFKIALEAIGEVPFTFGVRTEGESKLSGKVIIQYLQQLKELYVFKFGANNLILFITFWSILFFYVCYQLYHLVF
ncbi:dolichyl-phosphate beta-D-mannosyltransferase [Saccharomyces cerevisiae]|nr:dolichyl-phosphate beta-D-mannosyltransferase [Saccharomyces cerevisiae]